jgi:HAD superfamily hydrolase (TIGR01549 family)
LWIAPLTWFDLSSAAMDPPPLEAVVFDMDGTLIDSSRVVPAAFIATIEELGGPTLDRDAVIASYVLGPPTTIMEHFLGGPVEPSEIDRYHARLRAEAERRGVQPYPGIPEALEALVRSVALGVFTNADLGNVDVLLGAAGLRDRFAVVVGADEVAPNFKPAPDGLILACERLDVPAARTAYVGDSPQDGETAHHAGALAVAARWGHLMEDVGGFDVVADRPTDLPAVLGLA